LDSRTAKAGAADGAKPAGVLIPLYVRDGTWHVLLNLRSEHVGEHKGEVAFPGGSLDATDADIRACALREAHEEMGIRPEDVTILGELDTVLTRTGYLVWPTVGTIPYPYSFKVSSREVAEVMHVPLHAVLTDAALRHESRLGSDGNIHRRVGFAHGPHLVYGATATMLEQLLELVREAVDHGASLTPEVP
jgi:8-oxo-dGTP pyrophosphatase MutT (NUDIX family)